MEGQVSMTRRGRVRLLEGPERESIKVLRFVFPVGLLIECARRVDFTRRRREEMAYIVGEAQGDRRIARRIVEVPTQGDLVSVCDLPRSLSALHAATRDGNVLVAVAHSHPEWYASPSRIDWRTQLYVERDYDLIGLVFGWGGYVRFYRLRPFDLEIQGKGEGVEEVRPGAVYRLPCSRLK